MSPWPEVPDLQQLPSPAPCTRENYPIFAYAKEKRNYWVGLHWCNTPPFSKLMVSQRQSPFFLMLQEDKKHLLLRYFVPDAPATNPVCLCRFHRGASTAAETVPWKLVPCFALLPACTSQSFWDRCRKDGVWKATYALQSHISLSLHDPLRACTESPELCFSLLQTDVPVWDFLHTDLRCADNQRLEVFSDALFPRIKALLHSLPR